MNLRDLQITSSAEAYSVPQYPIQARALPIAEVSQFSKAEVLFILDAVLISSAYPVPVIWLAWFFIIAFHVEYDWEINFYTRFWIQNK